MDLATLQPGQLYAAGSPIDPRRIVLIDPDAWRWHPDDAPQALRYVHPSGRRLRYKRVGARTGVNTGSLVLRQREPVPSEFGLNSLSLLDAVAPITTLRRGANPSGTGNDTNLVAALTQGPDGEFQPWVAELLERHRLHFDLVDPRTIVSTWEDWQVKAAAHASEIADDEAHAAASAAAHDEFVDGLVGKLAALGITHSRFGEAMVTEVDDDTVRMPYAVLADLLARVPS
jgi:hypothetical protein